MEIIKATIRDPAAKAKQLRRAGIVPCVIDGADLKHSLSVQIDAASAAQIKNTMRSGSKADVEVNGMVYHTLIKELEHNVINNSVIHVSFHILDADKKVNSVADVVLANKEKVQGILEQIQMQIPHAARPEFLIDTVTVDISKLSVGTTLTVGDIPEFQNKNIELQTDPGNIVVRVVERKRVDEEPAEADEAAKTE